MINNLTYRTWNNGIPPKQIKLEVPGWAGERNYDIPQPWHCRPFTDGATYGLEIIYPYNDVIVKYKDGICEFEPESPYFANFAKDYFGFTSSLDIKTEEGYGLMIMPHPRFFTDRTGEVPVPSIGFIESDWWCKIFFIAFKAPLNRYVFKKGDGIAQLLVLPKNPQYNIKKMNPSEETQRAMRESIIGRHPEIATKKWYDKDGNAFDNRYKVLKGMSNRNEFLDELANKEIADKLSKQEIRSNKIKRKLIK